MVPYVPREKKRAEENGKLQHAINKERLGAPELEIEIKALPGE